MNDSSDTKKPNQVNQDNEKPTIPSYLLREVIDRSDERHVDI